MLITASSLKKGHEKTVLKLKAKKNLDFSNFYTAKYSREYRGETEVFVLDLAQL